MKSLRFLVCFSLALLVLLSWGATAVSAAAVFNDFNGDGVSDLAAYDVNTGNWFIRSQGPVGPENPPIAFGQNWGGAGLVPIVGDYNGDGLCDLAVYSQSTGNWYIRSLGDVNAPPICFGQNWGGPGLIPVAGDYNGDGAFDLAVYERITGNWFIRSLGNLNAPPIAFGQNWGNIMTKPVSGDFNNDGYFDLAVRDISTGNWFIRSLGPGAPIAFGLSSSSTPFGDEQQYTVGGDFNGDGVWDLAIYENFHDVMFTWDVNSLVGYSGTYEEWGGAKAVPVEGDYDGDRKSDLAVYDLSTGNWFIKEMGYNGALINFGQNWGGAGLIPVGSYNIASLKFVLYNNSGTIHSWNASLSSDLKATSGGAHIAVYLGSQHLDSYSTCHYTLGSTINRYAYDLDYALVNSQTGETIKTGTIDGDAPSCPYFTYGSGTLYGDPITLSEVEKILRALLHW